MVFNRTRLFAALASAPVVSFERLNAVHLEKDVPDLCVAFGAPFFLVRTKEQPLPKVALQPDGASLAYVHFAHGASLNVSLKDATLIQLRVQAGRGGGVGGGPRTRAISPPAVRLMSRATPR